MTSKPVFNSLEPNSSGEDAYSKGSELEVLVKSRERVKAYGEVFTPRYMVDQMLDLVSAELETGPNFVDKTFFEPAAGDGNFLVAILQRKLRAIKLRYRPEFWSDESLFALASIYGVELLQDNHEAAHASMLAEFVAFHESNNINCSANTNLFRSAKFLLNVNVVQGNTLTGINFQGDSIQFSWWHRVPDVPGTVRREPFSLSSLRDVSAFDFNIYPVYNPCRIDQVHKEVRADV